MGRNKEIWITATALSVVIGNIAGAATGEKSGTVGAVQPPFTTVKNGRLVPLNVGDPVFGDQEVRTGPNGRAQIVMLDRSSLTVGPNTELTIETYRYDREESRGEMVMKAAKGLFRFVGGLISKRRPVQVRTNVGTIGIRGAVVVIEALENGGFRLMFMYGDEATFEDLYGNVERINRPGYVMDISPDGDVSISEIDSSTLGETVALLEGTEGRSVAVEEIGGIDPDLIDLVEDDPAEAIRRLEEITNSSDADFELTQELLEVLGSEPGGTGGAL